MGNYFEKLLEDIWDELVIGVQKIKRWKGDIIKSRTKVVSNPNYFSHFWYVNLHFSVNFR